MVLETDRRVALITGAARGIGKTIAKKLAMEGCILMLNDINEASLTDTVGEFRNQGFKAQPVIGDISIGEDVQKMMEQIIALESRIDILVNNAGVSYKKEGGRIPLLEIPEEQWDRVLDINLKGAFLCSQAAAKHMIEQKYGRIVNISSMAGKLGDSGPAGPHYMASKAGLMSLTKSLAFELAPYGIRCNAVAPGVIKTEMMTASSEEVNRKFLEKIPMNRFGTPEEVADAVYFLVSDVSSYITGEILDLNGGILMD